MKKLHKRILFLLLECFAFSAFGQDSVLKYELIHDSREVVDKVTVLDSTTVLRVIDNLKNYQDPNRRYLVLDNQLQPVFDTIISIPFRQKLLATSEHVTESHTLYYDARKGAATILSIHPKTIEQQSIQLPNRIYQPQFVISDSQVYVDNRTRNKECIYVKNRFTNEEVKQYRVSRKNKRARVYSMYFEKLSNDEVVYAWREIGPKGHFVHLKIWDETGRLKLSFPFHIPNQTISNLSVVPSGEEGYVISGTYGKMDGSGSTGSGVFLSKVEDGSIIETKTYSFVDLTHYFDYFDRYEKEEMLRKIKRLKKHEKSTDIHVGNVIHGLIEVDHSFFLTVEIVTKIYDNVYGITRNGNTVAGAPQEFKGYHHSHAIVCRFDSAYNLLHDYYISIDMNLPNDDAIPHLQTTTVHDSVIVGLAKVNSYKLGVIRPHELMQLETDSSFHANSTDIIYTRNLTLTPSGAAVVYGEKIRQDKNGLGKQENIYFIEKRKLR